jgi:hypothetical protein
MREKVVDWIRALIIALTVIAAVTSLTPVSTHTLAQTPNRWGWRNLYFGQFERGCPSWRYELSALPDGVIELHLIEPTTHRFWWQGEGADRSYELLIGEPPCQFRVKIERSR